MSQSKKTSNPLLTPEHAMEKGFYNPDREVPAVGVVLGHGAQGQPSPAQEPSASENRPQPAEKEEDETPEDTEESKAPAGRRPKLHG